MKAIHCIWVGKCKAPFWKDAGEHYRKNLGRHVKIRETIIRDASGKLDTQSRNDVEGEKILSAVKPGDFVVCLDDKGETVTSEKLSVFFTRRIEDPRQLVFIIGGAYGLSESVLNRCDYRLSLSPMTFTHEMARVLLLEQLYRAVSIAKGLPYHHG